MISTIEFKKCMANTGFLSVVIGKLHHGKKPCSIILLEFDKGLEIGFYCTILSFSLTVCLWVEAHRESLLNAKEIAWWWPKLWGEKRSPVGNNQVWETVMPHHYVDNDFCKAQGINGDFDWLVINYIYKPIDSDED